MSLPLISRRSLLAAGTAAMLWPATQATAKRNDWRTLAEDVRSEMRWAWRNYREHAWGKDQIKPISGGFESFPLKDHHLGLSLVEALDTLWIMGLDEEFRDAVQWVKQNLDFDVDGDVSVFETSIRLVGGLLERGEDITVCYAVDGQDALTQMELHVPDLVLTDVHLGAMADQHVGDRAADARGAGRDHDPQSGLHALDPFLAGEIRHDLFP